MTIFSEREETLKRRQSRLQPLSAFVWKYQYSSRGTVDRVFQRDPKILLASLSSDCVTFRLLLVIIVEIKGHSQRVSQFFAITQRSLFISLSIRLLRIPLTSFSKTNEFSFRSKFRGITSVTSVTSGSRCSPDVYCCVLDATNFYRPAGLPNRRATNVPRETTDLEISSKRAWNLFQVEVSAVLDI